MKLIYTLTSLSLLSLSSLASAAEDCKTCDPTLAKTGECSDGTCNTSETAENTAKYIVTGMTCESCSNKVKTTLAAVEGVTVKSACHKSGNVVVNYDQDKTDKSKVQTALASTGFTVTGEKLDIPVLGMTCGTCAKKVTAALTSLEGCTVGSVCHKSGHTTVTIDPAKTSEAKVIETINATGFKATKEKAAPTTKS